MYPIEREQRILEYLHRVQIASTNQIQSVTGASIATTRRDLNNLEKAGLLHRSHGYVQLAEPSPAFTADDPDAAADKERIGMLAAAQINDGDAIFLGSGTTCTMLARHLENKRDLTIMTINLDVVQQLTRLKNVKLSILGGDVHVEAGYIQTMDEYTIQTLNRLYFDKVFVTVNGIDFEYGYSIRKQLQLSLFQHLLDNCKEFYCLADGSKFEKRTYLQFCPIDAIQRIVTTADIREKYAEQFAQNNISVFSD